MNEKEQGFYDCEAINTVTITEIEYKTLLSSQKFLNALEAAGLDNWDGYEQALDSMD